MEDFATLLARALADPAVTVTPAKAGVRRPEPPSAALAIAVSGGPDSVALLHLAAAAFPGQVTALTVDHALRSQSAVEAQTLARLCAAAQIPHVTLRWTGAKPAANIQAAARSARYRLMANWCAANAHPLLATAHHADDQAETLLMRLARGSGSAGLAGIRASRPLGQGVTLVRPLLAIRRVDLAQIAAASGWPLVDDPTNRDPRHARTHARALLAATPWLDPQRLADSAAHLADVEASLDWTASLAWAGRATTTETTVTLDPHGLPAELVRRLTARAIAHFEPGKPPRGPDLARLIARLAAGNRATIAGVSAKGGLFWHFTRAPPRRAIEAE